MKPVNFEGQNTVLGEAQPQYMNLPALRCDDTNGTVWSCWELSDADIEDLIKHRKIWIGQLTFRRPFAPTMVSSQMPLEVCSAVHKAKQKAAKSDTGVKINLCDDCTKDVPTCDANPVHACDRGGAANDDSVVECAAHNAKRPDTCLTDGSPVTPDHREIDPTTGQQKGYVVLTSEERAKGFVRPVRQSYIHDKCGTVTTMGLALAETYARKPNFYSGTFCCGCRTHFPVAEFKWVGTDEVVGS